MSEVQDPEPPEAAPSWPQQVYTGDPEWYTPDAVLALVRAVLGAIDVDPASCAVAQATVQAHTFYTIEDDGLRQPWPGTVFCNPPYKLPDVARFIGKLCEELDAQRTTAAILLVNNATETDWFQRAFARADAVCFPDGKIHFVSATHDGHAGPCVGQALLYYGPDPLGFCTVFATLGVSTRVVCADAAQLALAATPPAPDEVPAPLIPERNYCIVHVSLSNKGSVDLNLVLSSTVSRRHTSTFGRTIRAPRASCGSIAIVSAVRTQRNGARPIRWTSAPSRPSPAPPGSEPKRPATTTKSPGSGLPRPHPPLTWPRRRASRPTMRQNLCWASCVRTSTSGDRPGRRCGGSMGGAASTVTQRKNGNSTRRERRRMAAEIVTNDAWLAQFAPEAQPLIVAWFASAASQGPKTPEALLARVTRLVSRRLAWSVDPASREACASALLAVAHQRPGALTYAATLLAAPERST